MRSTPFLVALALSACAEAIVRLPSQPIREVAPEPGATTTRQRGATGSWTPSAPELAPTSESELGDASEETMPSQDLPWALPPTGVSCVLRGKTAPFPPPCDSQRVAVTTASGAPLAAFDATDLEVVWGIRRAGAAPWIHARSAGFTLTGFTTLDVKFRVERGTPLVADHVWVLPDAPVEIVGATSDGALEVRVVDDVAGLQDLVGEIPCDAVTFDPPAPTDGLPITAPPPPPNEAERVSPRHDRLTLRATPGGPPLVTIAGSEKASLWVDLRVAERKAGATRVLFETDHARFDVWVEDAELTQESIGGHGFGSVGCPGSIGVPHGSSTAPPGIGIVRAESAIRVGLRPKDAVPALRVVGGVSLELGEVRGGFVEVLSVDSFYTLAENRLWIERSALVEPSP
jgi:hypothetical protein